MYTCPRPAGWFDRLAPSFALPPFAYRIHVPEPTKGDKSKRPLGALDSEAASRLSGQPTRRDGGSTLHGEPLQQVMVDFLAHLDVDHPSVADCHGQTTEPAPLQAREGVEQERGFSVADAVRQVHR